MSERMNFLLKISEKTLWAFIRGFIARRRVVSTCRLSHIHILRASRDLLVRQLRSPGQNSLRFYEFIKTDSANELFHLAPRATWWNEGQKYFPGTRNG